MLRIIKQRQIFTGIDCENLVKVVKISFYMKFIFSGSRSKFSLMSLEITNITSIAL